MKLSSDTRCELNTIDFSVSRCDFVYNLFCLDKIIQLPTTSLVTLPPPPPSNAAAHTTDLIVAPKNFSFVAVASTLGGRLPRTTENQEKNKPRKKGASQSAVIAAALRAPRRPLRDSALFVKSFFVTSSFFFFFFSFFSFFFLSFRLERNNLRHLGHLAGSPASLFSYFPYHPSLFFFEIRELVFFFVF